jgi:hypothetical protein
MLLRLSSVLAALNIDNMKTLLNVEQTAPGLFQGLGVHSCTPWPTHIVPVKLQWGLHWAADHNQVRLKVMLRLERNTERRTVFSVVFIVTNVAGSGTGMRAFWRDSRKPVCQTWEHRKFKAVNIRTRVRTRRIQRLYMCLTDTDVFGRDANGVKSSVGCGSHTGFDARKHKT